eukprot:gene2248-17183_t
MGEELGAERRQLEEARSDNVKLYEKAPEPSGNRYQCGPLAFEFGGQGEGADAAQSLGGSMRSRNTTGRNRQFAACFPGADEGDEEKHVKAYEARINPFTEFQKTEVESREGDEEKHVKAYEARINPFTEFQKAEVESRFAACFPGADEGDEKKHVKAYELRINPFTEFQKAEVESRGAQPASPRSVLVLSGELS